MSDFRISNSLIPGSGSIFITSFAQQPSVVFPRHHSALSPHSTQLLTPHRRTCSSYNIQLLYPTHNCQTTPKPHISLPLPRPELPRSELSSPHFTSGLIETRGPCHPTPLPTRSQSSRAIFSFPPHRAASPQCQLFLTSLAHVFRDSSQIREQPAAEKPSHSRAKSAQRSFPASRQSPARFLIGCRECRAPRPTPRLFASNPAVRPTTNKRAPGLSAPPEATPTEPRAQLYPGPPRKDAGLQ